MKKSEFLALSFLAILFSFSACDNMPEPDYWADQNRYGSETLYSENFGTSATQTGGTLWPLVADYNGYSKTGTGAEKVTLSAEGTVTVRTTDVSTHSGASGACNAMMAAAGASLLINDIATCGAQNLTLSFGSNVSNEILTVAWKINGTTEWHEIAYQKTSNEWGPVDTLNIKLPAGTNTIKLKFTAASTQYGARVDDIKLTTADAVGTPVVDPDDMPDVPEPDPASQLTEDFEGFQTGTDTYFSDQQDAKGWKGYTVQGVLEPDLRLFNTTNNKYVQFSAHRSNRPDVTGVQEMWLVSPRLDVDAAESKIVSFHTAGGYFNDATEFKVYALAGNDPISDNKTELTGWRLAAQSDLGSGFYTAYIPSGNIDLSAFTGIIRIAFYYKGTSGSGNSTTYQLDNFAFGTSISTLTVTPQSLSFTKEGGEKTFTVTCDKAWTATSSNPTDFAVQTAGNTVTVTATANTGAAQRSAAITVKTEDGQKEQQVNITQTGQGATGNAVFTETFAKVTGDAWTAATSALNDYTSFDNAGWTGSRVYPAGGVIKMGTSGASGSVTTPDIDLSANDGIFTLEFKVLTWYSDSKTIKVYVNDTGYETGEIANYDTANPMPAQTVIMELDGGTTATKIKFESLQASHSRFWLDEVKILQ